MGLKRGSEATALFHGGANSVVRLIGYVALAAALMVGDHRLGLLPTLRHGASLVVEPIYTLAAQPARLVALASDAVSDRRELVEENTRLRQALLLANARLNRMHALAGQNQRLKQLLDVQQMLGMDVQMARVMGVDLGAFRHRLMIDAGTDEGARVGSVVIDAHGIVGQVVELTRHTAQVMLVTDPNHAVPVLDERSGLRAVAYGSGDSGYLRLPTVPLTADVRVGDKLLTSGLGGRFPAGFPVGQVVEIAPDRDGSFAIATVVPSAALDRSVEVLLVHDQPPPVGPPAPAGAIGPPVAGDDRARAEP